VQELMVEIERAQHGQLRRMARRLSAFTDLNKYRLPDAPKWRTHDFETYVFANDYHAALNYGDPTGAAYLAVAHPLVAARALVDRLTPAARRTVMARLATLDLADASAIASTHSSGALRFNGRRELRAIDTLETHVVDPSDEQSATAILDKISGAVLIGARQRQARAQLLAGVVEQLLVDGKRARDADAAAMNMQLVTWRDAGTVNAAFVAGSADALKAWRQP
jgi:hypothetical protein